MDLLIVVDVQYDFLPGGALPIEGGYQVVNETVDLINSGRFDHVIATADYHPHGHISFKSSWPDGVGRVNLNVRGKGYYEIDLWPDHCVKVTKGAQIHSEIFWKADSMAYKGRNPLRESYGAFYDMVGEPNEFTTEAIPKFIDQSNGDLNIYICGLATDKCVFHTAKQAQDFSDNVYVIKTATRGTTEEAAENALEELQSFGVELIDPSLSILE